MPRLISAIVLVIGFAPVAFAKTGDATAVIQKTNARFRELLAAKTAPGSAEEKNLTEKLTAEMRGLFDIAGLAKNALGPHWNEMKESEQTDLVDTLQKLVERSYLGDLRDNLSYEMTFAGEEPQADGVLVKSVLKANRNGRVAEIALDYWLHQSGAGWRVDDVVIDDSSMVRNYRSQFNRIIAKDGIAGLLSKMHKKLGETESKRPATR